MDFREGTWRPWLNLAQGYAILRRGGHAYVAPSVKAFLILTLEPSIRDLRQEYFSSTIKT